MVGPPNDGIRAWTHAKAGIARAGASRAGFYLYNVGVDILQWNGSTWVVNDFTPWIQHGTLRITHGSDDERDTASFTLIPQCPLTPRVGQRMAIKLGGAPEFAGVIVVAQHRRRPMNESPWIDVQCVDSLHYLDARLVTWQYPSQSATITVNDLIRRFVPGCTTHAVAPDLPVIPILTVINQRISTILRSITATVGGGFRVDHLGDLHVWHGSPYETGAMAGTNPQPLTNTLATLKAFRRTYDASNLRTRVVVEGQRTEVLIGIPPGADGIQFGRISTIPVRDSSFFAPIAPTPSTDPFSLLRLDHQVMCLDTRASYIPAFDPTKNPTGTRLTADVVPTTDPLDLVIFPVEDISTFTGDHAEWCQVGDQVVWIDQVDRTNNWLYTRGGAYWGSLVNPVSKGASIVQIPSLVHVLTWESQPSDARVAQPVLGQTKGAPLVARVHVEDAAARDEWAQVEDSDGIYEHLIQDGRLGIPGAKDRAALDLADFSRPILTLDWETDDMNAHPGRRQLVALGAPDPVDADITITHTEVAFLVANHPPRRHCTGSRVKVARLLDFMLTNNTDPSLT